MPAKSSGSPAAHRTHVLITVLLIVALALVFLLSLISFSASTHSYHAAKLKGRHGRGTGCVLSATQFRTSNGQVYPYRGQNQHNPCNFAITGEILLAVYAIVMAIVVILTRLFGFFHFVVVVVELVVAVIMTLLSFCVSMTISIGSAVTCGELEAQYKDYSCYMIAKSNGMGGIYLDQVTAQVTAWLGFCILLIIIGLYVAVILFRNQLPKPTRSLKLPTLVLPVILRKPSSPAPAPPHKPSAPVPPHKPSTPVPIPSCKPPSPVPVPPCRPSSLNPVLPCKPSILVPVPPCRPVPPRRPPSLVPVPPCRPVPPRRPHSLVPTAPKKAVITLQVV